MAPLNSTATHINDFSERKKRDTYFEKIEQCTVQSKERYSTLR